MLRHFANSELLQISKYLTDYIFASPLAFYLASSDVELIQAITSWKPHFKSIPC